MSGLSDKPPQVSEGLRLFCASGLLCIAGGLQWSVLSILRMTVALFPEFACDLEPGGVREAAAAEVVGGASADAGVPANGERELP